MELPTTPVGIKTGLNTARGLLQLLKELPTRVSGKTGIYTVRSPRRILMDLPSPVSGKTEFFRIRMTDRLRTPAQRSPKPHPKVNMHQLRLSPPKRLP